MENAETAERFAGCLLHAACRLQPRGGEAFHFVGLVRAYLGLFLRMKSFFSVRSAVNSSVLENYYYQILAQISLDFKTRTSADA